MDEEQVLMSETGLKKLKEELNQLKSVKRKEVAQRIKEAIDLGDISENAEYDEAKNEQAFIEGRIRTLEQTIDHAVVVDEEDQDSQTVNIGKTVKIRDLETDDIFEYTIVGSMESDPAEGKISYESPVGAALYQKQIGETVDVKLPNGVVRYEILGLE